MLKRLKNWLNLHGRKLVLFFDHSEKKIMSKNSVLVLSEILELFGNILTPNDKYSLSISRVFNATNSDATISKSKNIL